MRHIVFALSAPALISLAACSNVGANYQPVVDGPVGPNYNADLAQCQALARSQPTINERTAASALTGAATGAAASAIINDSSDDLGRSAAAGALVGATASAIQQTQNQEVIVRNCMRGRGYNVVG
ncbi:glycine zipper family protein [Lutimaribacter marinistellae]|uniref:Glycine zipper family protein n=1 Tax=Lutimaribacter marinistellae TaxID=1820329 RepID=A0ABV7TH17_9RHOB